jgi:hypothetical protein
MSHKPASAITATLLAAVVVACVARAPAAAGQPGLFVSVTDDVFVDSPSTAFRRSRSGSGLSRRSTGHPDDPDERRDVASFTGMAAAAAGCGSVVTVFGRAVMPVTTGASRTTHTSATCLPRSRHQRRRDLEQPNLGASGSRSSARAAPLSATKRCSRAAGTFTFRRASA